MNRLSHQIFCGTCPDKCTKVGPFIEATGRTFFDSSCHVIRGRLTIYAQDPAFSYKLYSTSLEFINMIMDDGLLDSYLPNDQVARYIESEEKEISLPFTPKLLEPSLQKKSNIVPILVSSLAGFLVFLLFLLVLFKRRNRFKQDARN